MISAPWLHHSTGETPGGLVTAACLPAQRVPFLNRGWTAQSETAPRCASQRVCTAVRGGHGRVSKAAARVMTPKVNVTPWVLLLHDNGPLGLGVTRALFFDRGGGHDQRAVVAPQHR